MCSYGGSYKCMAIFPGARTKKHFLFRIYMCFIYEKDPGSAKIYALRVNVHHE